MHCAARRKRRIDHCSHELPLGREPFVCAEQHCRKTAWCQTTEMKLAKQNVQAEIDEDVADELAEQLLDARLSCHAGVDRARGQELAHICMPTCCMEQHPWPASCAARHRLSKADLSAYWVIPFWRPIPFSVITMLAGEQQWLLASGLGCPGRGLCTARLAAKPDRGLSPCNGTAASSLSSSRSLA